MVGGTWLVVPHPWACGSTLGTSLEQSFIQIAANGSSEPILLDSAHIINVWLGTKAAAIDEHLLTAPKHQITTAFDVFALR
jgi:hypothetical protein